MKAISHPLALFLLRCAAGLGLFVLLLYGILSMGRSTREQALADASLETLEKAASRGDRDSDLLLYLSYRLAQDGRAAEAAEKMEQVVRREPRSARYWDVLGRCAAAAGRAPRAVEAYQKAIALEPGMASAHVALGRIYGEAGLVTDALAQFERAVKIDPGASVSEVLWAKYLARKGRLPEAWKRLTAALARDPMQDDAYPLVVEIGPRMGRFEEAAQLMRRRLRLTDVYQLSAMRSSLIRMLLAHDRKPQTLKEAEELARVAITDPNAPADNNADLGRVLLLRGDLEGARRALEAGRRRQPDHRECLVLLAEVAGRQGRAREAALLRGRIPPQKAAPSPPEIAPIASGDGKDRLTRARALQRAGRYGEAAEECQEALRRAAQAGTPQNPEATALLQTCRAQALVKLAETDRSARGGARK